MKAIVVYEAGGSEKLVYSEVDKPKLKEGWSLVKVKGFGINRSEIFTRKGYSPNVVFPRILGIECVGIIENSKVFNKGEKVVSIMGEMGREYDGSYAEYVLIPDHQIYVVESDLAWEDLAAIPETYYTALGSLKNLKIEQNDKILVRAASSGVGIAFVRLLRAKFKDIDIYGSTNNLAKKEILIKEGYTNIILDVNHKLQTELMFDKVLELVGPISIKDSIKHLNEGGIVCNTGLLGGKWYLEEFDPIMELKNSVYLTTFYSGNVSKEKIQELFDYIKEYRVNVKPERIFRLKDIREAHDYLDDKKGFGKVVCVID